MLGVELHLPEQWRGKRSEIERPEVLAGIGHTATQMWASQGSVYKAGCAHGGFKWEAAHGYCPSTHMGRRSAVYTLSVCLAFSGIPRCAALVQCTV